MAPDVRSAGWFRPGPAPGARGPAVLVGRVDAELRLIAYGGAADGDDLIVYARPTGQG